MCSRAETTDFGFAMTPNFCLYQVLLPDPSLCPCHIFAFNQEEEALTHSHQNIELPMETETCGSDLLS